MGGQLDQQGRESLKLKKELKDRVYKPEGRKNGSRKEVRINT
jgi:hypothetical protein